MGVFTKESRMINRRNAPEFNLTRGPATLTGPPPYEFRNVTMRFFPLRADIGKLRHFCNQYLNLMPPEIAEFRPSMPYVFLQLVNYGEMSAEARSAGWVSQNEVLFSIFLDWYRKDESGNYQFQRSASVAPFIFVDQEASQASGREVYGWPKMEGWPSEIDLWPHTPDDRSDPILRISANIFPEVFQGSRIEKEVVLSIDYEEPPSLTRVPPAMRGRLNPVSVFADALANGIHVWAHMVDTATAFPWRGYDPDTFREMPQKFAKILESFSQPSSATHTVNMKQFRDARYADAICYQAIVDSQMELMTYHAGGLLGDENLLRGDPSSGYRIRIHKFPTLPVVETLGLEVEPAPEEVPFTTSKPEFPFWANVDLKYTQGVDVCWRTRTTKGWNVPVDLGDTQPDFVLVPPNPESPAEPPEKRHPYNTTLGTSIISMPGPFRFPNSTVRVLPLLADPCKLQKFCDSYLNRRQIQKENQGEQSADQDAVGLDHQDLWRFEAWGRYVYMLIWSHEGMWSKTDDIGQWAQREVRFSFPVKLYEKDSDAGKKWRLATAGLVSPYAFNDSEIATATGRELYGWPTIRGQINSPGTRWLEDSGPDDWGHQKLLELRVPTLAALFMGQKMETRTLVEVAHGLVLPQDDSRDWMEVGGHWGQTLKDELERKQSSALHEGRSCPKCKQPILEKAPDEVLEETDEVPAGKAPDEQKCDRCGYPSNQNELDNCICCECKQPLPFCPKCGAHEPVKLEEGECEKAAGIPIPAAERKAKPELECLLSLALESLANEKPINEFSLKQFRDAEQPLKACYQSLIRVPQVIERLYDLREIETRTHVRIHRTASQPIVETLGLVHKLVAASQGGGDHILEPVRPFWMRMDVRMDEAQELWRTAIGEEPSKTPPDQKIPYYQWNTNIGERLLRSAGQSQGHAGQQEKALELIGEARQLIDWLVRSPIDLEGGDSALEFIEGLESLTSEGPLESLTREGRQKASQLIGRTPEFINLLEPLTSGGPLQSLIPEEYREKARQLIEKVRKLIEFLLSLTSEEDSAGERKMYFLDGCNIGVGTGTLLDNIRDHERDENPPVWCGRAQRQHLRLWLREWQSEIRREEASECETTPTEKKLYLTLAEAIEAVENLEPQMAIECTLSQEWCNWGTPRIYLNGIDPVVKQKPLFCVRRDSVGAAAGTVFPIRRGDRAWILSDEDVYGWYPGELIPPDPNNPNSYALGAGVTAGQLER